MNKDELQRMAIETNESQNGLMHALVYDNADHVDAPEITEMVYNLGDASETVYIYDSMGKVVEEVEYKTVETAKLEELEQEAASFRAIQHLYNNGIFWDEVNGQKRFNYCRFGSHLKDMDILESEDGPDDHSNI